MAILELKNVDSIEGNFIVPDYQLGGNASDYLSVENFAKCHNLRADFVSTGSVLEVN